MLLIAYEDANKVFSKAKPNKQEAVSHTTMSAVVHVVRNFITEVIFCSLLEPVCVVIVLPLKQ